MLYSCQNPLGRISLSFHLISSYVLHFLLLPTAAVYFPSVQRQNDAWVQKRMCPTEGKGFTACFISRPLVFLIFFVLFTYHVGVVPVVPGSYVLKIYMVLCPLRLCAFPGSYIPRVQCSTVLYIAHNGTLKQAVPQLCIPVI